ncbi:MAG: transglutaminase-like domain-containing protein, partial [Phycisphaeraceae bacterium]|nr:transglutaminase-like domain-containing protein [Phycisphaeraceae bacterium]
MKRVRSALIWLLMLGTVVLAGEPAAEEAGQSEPRFERWYRLTLDGEPVGWAVNREWADAEQITYEERLYLALRRAGATVATTQTSRFVQTPSGEPVKAESIQETGGQAHSVQWRFTDDGSVVVTRIDDGRGKRSTRPVPEEPWLTPEAGRLRMVEHLRKFEDRPADEPVVDRYRMYRPSSGPEPVTVTNRLTSLDPDKREGGAVAEVEVTSSANPGLTLAATVDRQARLVTLRMPMFGSTLLMKPADAAVAGETFIGPEIMERTLVSLDRPIDRPRKKRRAAFIVGGVPESFTPATTSVQRATAREAAGVWRVVIDLDAPVATTEDRPTGEDRQANPLIDADHPAIAALLKEWSDQMPDADEAPAARAQWLTRRVGRYVKTRDLGRGFDRASTVAQRAEGDCTEHAVLLAALLRRDGVPARVVGGLVYMDRFVDHESVFAWHLWTQAWIDGRWVDLDAAVGMDATH